MVISRCRECGAERVAMRKGGIPSYLKGTTGQCSGCGGRTDWVEINPIVAWLRSWFRNSSWMALRRDERRFVMLAVMCALSFIGIVGWGDSLLAVCGASEGVTGTFRKIVEPFTPGLIVGLCVFLFHGYIMRLFLANERLAVKLWILATLALPFVICLWGPSWARGTCLESCAGCVAGFLGRAFDDFGGFVMAWFLQVQLMWIWRRRGGYSDSIWEYLRSEKGIDFKPSVGIMVLPCLVIMAFASVPVWFAGTAIGNSLAVVKNSYVTASQYGVFPILIWAVISFVKGAV